MQVLPCFVLCRAVSAVSCRDDNCTSSQSRANGCTAVQRAERSVSAGPCLVDVGARGAGASAVFCLVRCGLSVVIPCVVRYGTNT